jgi:membrane-associated protease RseP (regulator of RpoE activity)
MSYSLNCLRCVKYSKYILISSVLAVSCTLILFYKSYIVIILQQFTRFNDIGIERINSINDKWEFLQPIYAYSLVASVFVGLLIITIKGYNKIKLGRFYLSIVLIIPYLFFNFSDPKPESVPPIVGNLSKESPEYELGIRAGDIITKIDDVLITSWEEVYKLTVLSLTNRFAVTFWRDNEEFTHVLTSTPFQKENPLFKRLTLPAQFPPIVGQVLEGQAASEAGLQKDDKIVSIGGVPIDDRSQVIDELQKYGDKQTNIIVERGGDKVTLTITPRLINKRVMIGVQFGAKKDFSTYVKRPIVSTGFFNPYPFNLWLTMANIIALIQIYIINRFLCSEIEAKLSKS